MSRCDPKPHPHKFEVVVRSQNSKQKEAQHLDVFQFVEQTLISDLDSMEQYQHFMYWDNTQ